MSLLCKDINTGWISFYLRSYQVDSCLFRYLHKQSLNFVPTLGSNGYRSLIDFLHSRTMQDGGLQAPDALQVVVNFKTLLPRSLSQNV